MDKKCRFRGIKHPIIVDNTDAADICLGIVSDSTFFFVVNMNI